jgi:hypothetical protein
MLSVPVVRGPKLGKHIIGVIPAVGQGGNGGQRKAKP